MKNQQFAGDGDVDSNEEMVDPKILLRHVSAGHFLRKNMNCSRLTLFPSWISILSSAASLLCLSSCGLFDERPIPKASHVLYEWYDGGGMGEVNVEINLTTQKALVRRGKTLIGWCYVATGREGKGTPAGNYRVQEKLLEKHSNKYGWVQDESGHVTHPDAKPGVALKPGETYHPAPMLYWQRLTSYGVGMHVGFIPEPGRPASHGCIRMPKEFCPLFYEVTKIGTPVRIRYGTQDAVIVWQ